MDLTPFFHNVDRIATALETIARNTAPTITQATQPLLSVEARDRILATIRGVDEPDKVDTAGTEGRARPQALSLEPDPEAMTRALDAVLEIYRGGTQTANGIAKSLRERGIPHPRGLQWHNISAKKLMDHLGLESLYRLPRPAAEPAPAAETRPESAAPPEEAGPEPEPEPALPGPDVAPAPVEAATERKINRAFVEKEFKPRRGLDDHMNLRGLLSEKTRANLEAHDRKRRDEQDMIAEAVAAGRVTKLPAGMDSEGNNHLEDGGSRQMRGNSLPLGPNTGSRVQARGSMN